MRDGQHEARQTGTNAPLVRFLFYKLMDFRSVQLALARERTANLTLLEACWRMTSPRGRVLDVRVLRSGLDVRCYRRCGVATRDSFGTCAGIRAVFATSPSGPRRLSQPPTRRHHTRQAATEE
jgi:hypothetical protein